MTEKKTELTVGELTSILKTTIEVSFQSLTVTGEISGLKMSSTGHLYFALKDDTALINAVIWRSTVSRLGFIPENGQNVIVTGSISVYEARGTYQIVCTSIRPYGMGDILAQLERRKKKYEELGWFDPSLKKTIPSRPSKIAVITSQSGAAIQDILNITKRRNPGMNIIILPAVVQGEEAAETISARIEQANRFLVADVIIVGRGGGSLEDLLPFSEECVIEAIHNSVIPVISAVGHETDWALSDYVADLRAPTPSAAAELVCSACVEQIESVNEKKALMYRLIDSKISNARLICKASSIENMHHIISSNINNRRMKADSALQQMYVLLNSMFDKTSNRIVTLKTVMQNLSPLSVLSRGYSIVTDSSGKTVSSSKKLNAGDVVNIRLYKGSASAQVKEVL